MKDDVSAWVIYRWLLGYILSYRKYLAILLAASSVVAFVELSIPKAIGYMIDTMIPESDVQAIVILILAITVALGVRLAARSLEASYQNLLHNLATRDLQLDLLQQLRKLGIPYMEAQPAGERLAFLSSEAEPAFQFYRSGLPRLIISFVFLFISFILMLDTHVWLTALIVPALLLHLLIGPRMNRRAASLGKELSAARRAENRKVYESLSALTEIRAAGSDKWDLANYLERVKELNNTFVNYYRVFYMRLMSTQASFAIGMVLLFVAGYFLIERGELSVGEFIAFLLIYAALMQHWGGFIAQWASQGAVVHQTRRLYEWFRMPVAVTEPSMPLGLQQIEGQLVLEQVDFHYREDRPVLRNVSLSIPAGSKAAFVGSSGSGKSTLIKLIGRFYEPTAGQIRLDNIPLNQLPSSILHRSVGFVFQETYLFGTSIRENIRFSQPDADDAAVEQAARKAFIHDFIQSLPQSYNTNVGERGTKLSGGERQRIAIARMILMNPSVIVLDEATSALDQALEADVKKALDSLFNNRTVIAIAHRLSTIRNFDQIYMMSEGHITENGTYEELMASKGEFYQLALGQEGEPA